MMKVQSKWKKINKQLKQIKVKKINKLVKKVNEK